MIFTMSIAFKETFYQQDQIGPDGPFLENGPPHYKALAYLHQICVHSFRNYCVVRATDTTPCRTLAELICELRSYQENPMLLLSVITYPSLQYSSRSRRVHFGDFTAETPAFY